MIEKGHAISQINCTEVANGGVSRVGESVGLAHR